MDAVAEGTRAAASLVLLTPTDDGEYKVLMIQRAKTMKFLPDVWAFPGGAVDQADAASPVAQRDPTLGPFRSAAVRETAEETGVVVRLGDTAAAHRADVPVFAHWVTPKEEGNRRFDTWFFLHVLDPTADARDALPALTPQPGEVANAKWVSPWEALKLSATAKRGFRLAPPTWVLLHLLAQYRSPRKCAASLAMKFGNDPKKVPRVMPVVGIDELWPVAKEPEAAEDATPQLLLKIPAASTALQPDEFVVLQPSPSGPRVRVVPVGPAAGHSSNL